jgi:signal transduction histidine kinase
MASIIWGMFSNAIEAMPNGRRVKITANNHVGKSNRRSVEITVEDEGAGIPPENIQKLFTAFYSTKGNGRGYGLWRSKNLVEQIGGIINVESAIGVGSKFTIMLPATTRHQKRKNK